jgi:hypothetical protein
MGESWRSVLGASLGGRGLGFDAGACSRMEEELMRMFDLTHIVMENLSYQCSRV